MKKLIGDVNSNESKKFCETIKNILNNYVEFSNNIKYTPRIIGDMVQNVLDDQIVNFGYKKTKNIITKRSIADIELYDNDNSILTIDIKTHSLDDKFNMPNLISVKRLNDFYKKENNKFMILLVEYSFENKKPIFSSIRFFPIEKLDWSCLGIGSLGYGQIQIKNANNIIFNNSSREQWIEQFNDQMKIFINKQYIKLDKLKKLFE